MGEGNWILEDGGGTLEGGNGAVEESNAALEEGSVAREDSGGALEVGDGALEEGDGALGNYKAGGGVALSPWVHDEALLGMLGPHGVLEGMVDCGDFQADIQDLVWV